MKLQSWRRSDNFPTVDLHVFLFFMLTLWQGSNPQANFFTLQLSTLWDSSEFAR
jgi:hypothetical protein